MQKSGHTDAEGQRVHILANLGGLIAIAGLEALPPDVLLGGLLSFAAQFTQSTAEQKQRWRKKGLQTLQARNSEKRSFKCWQRAQQTARFDLTQAQMIRLIRQLGGKVPLLEKDIAPELRCLLRGL